MKKAISIFGFLAVAALLSGCKKPYPASDFSIEIIDLKNMKDDIYAQCLIKNDSDEKLYFPIDSSSVEFFNWMYDKGFPFNSFYALFYKQNKKDTIYSSFFTDVYYEDTLAYFKLRKGRDSLENLNKRIIDSLGEQRRGLLWGIKYREVQKKSFYMNPKSSKTVFLKIDFQVTFQKRMAYDINSYAKREIENSYMQIAIRIDSTEAKEFLLPRDPWIRMLFYYELI